MSFSDIIESMNHLAEKSQNFTKEMELLIREAKQIPLDQMGSHPFLMGLTVFVLACFVGYYVVWRVTPALHSPLMAVTNAISSVIIVGAIVALVPEQNEATSILAFIAIALASVNIFGGFIITQRMLDMFKKKQ